MYSPAALPSSIARGTGEEPEVVGGVRHLLVHRELGSGLPVSLHSTALISSTRASIADGDLEQRVGAVLRGRRGPRRSNAASAAAYARSTSSAAEFGACA